MHIAVLAKNASGPALAALSTVHAWLGERGHTVAVDHRSAEAAGLPVGYDRDGGTVAGVELAVALGGDGTQLEAQRLFAAAKVPVFGVNLGRLGFLTDTEPDGMLDALEAVLDGNCQVEERMMLMGEVHRGDTVLGPVHAFNDLVVNKGALAQVVRLETTVDDDFVSSYLADGLIFSTPTGSTAYGLAAGGPIIQPNTDVMLVAPICPHILTNRPLIVSGGATVDCVVAEARGEVFLTIDGQEGFPLIPGDRLRVVRSPHRARLMRSHGHDFFQVLRTKMRWGTD